MKKEKLQLDQENKSGMESVREINNSSKATKKLYKKPFFWLLSLLALIAIGLAIFAGVYMVAQSKNKLEITNGWKSIVDENKVVQGLADKVTNQESFDLYRADLNKLKNTLESNYSKSQKLSFRASDVKMYQLFLKDYSVYIVDNIQYAEKINDFTQDTADSLKDKGILVKNSATNFKNNNKYIKDEMPNSAFEVQNVLLEANKLILSDSLASKARQLAEQTATAKDLADSKASENTAGSFLNAYLAGNAPLIRQFMTAAFQKEYDFEQLTYEARATAYPASFRILTNQRIEAGKYKDQANVLFKYRNGSSQYTVGYEMNIIFEPESSKWLVNSISERNSF
ncbi:MAG: hypothetical protein NTY56_00320 [Patescibacteria group bacterium]|nr:hypothetical protein [Patescibacteria group bacterium]